MNVVSRTANRVKLESGTHEGSVRLTWDGKTKKWLLTAFEKRDGGGDATTTDTGVLSGRDDTASHADASDESIDRTLREFHQRGSDDPRGRITFDQSGKATITLFSKADLSTVMHEAGHLFLRVTADLHAAEGERLPEQMRSDWATTLDFLGAKPGEKLTVDQHERFARAWEEYLREGKSPSKGLRRVFEHAWAWLRSVYKATPVERISPEMRGVFDRMIAADDEIAAASREEGLTDHLAKYKGIATDAELEALARTAEEARLEAKTRVMSEAVKEGEREKQAWWKEARAGLRTEVAREVSERPEYAALTAIKNGTYPRIDAPGVLVLPDLGEGDGLPRKILWCRRRSPAPRQQRRGRGWSRRPWRGRRWRP